MDNIPFYFEILGYASVLGVGIGLLLSIVGIVVNAFITIFKKI